MRTLAIVLALGLLAIPATGRHSAVGRWLHRRNVVPAAECCYGGGWEGPRPMVVCVPVKDALPDRFTFEHPAFGPGYSCRLVH